MKLKHLTAALGLSVALIASGCGAANEQQADTPAPGNTNTAGQASEAPKLTGKLTGIGASSQKVAVETWIAGLQTANQGLDINYSPEGSGAGRKAFQGGGADFAGSDRAFKADENVAGSFGKCKAESKALDLPLYISPIAIIFKVEGVDKLKLDAKTAAAIFSGQIKNWNDPKIAALNEGVTFPNLPITVVHRSDNSGTTENFTDYLNQASDGVWTEKANGDWPAAFQGEAAKGTSGVVAAVSGGAGTIGYADASQAKGVGVAEVGRDGKFSDPNAEAAAMVVEKSPREEGRDEHDVALKLDRKSEGYPIVLVAYTIVCAEYKDAETATLVKGYLNHAASKEGQQAAAEKAGSAPLSAELTKQVQAAIDSIK